MLFTVALYTTTDLGHTSNKLLAVFLRQIMQVNKGSKQVIKIRLICFYSSFSFLVDIDQYFIQKKNR